MALRPPKRLKWRLAVLMAENDIRTATELHRRLTEFGVDLTSDRVSRIVNAFPERLNTTLLAGLLSVLNCELTDLIQVLPPGPAPQPTERAPASTLPPKAAAASGTDVAGDKPAVPRPKAKRKIEAAPPVNAPRPVEGRLQAGLDALAEGMLSTKVHPLPLKPRN